MPNIPGSIKIFTNKPGYPESRFRSASPFVAIIIEHTRSRFIFRTSALIRSLGQDPELLVNYLHHRISVHNNPIVANSRHTPTDQETSSISTFLYDVEFNKDRSKCYGEMQGTRINSPMGTPGIHKALSDLGVTEDTLPVEPIGYTQLGSADQRRRQGIGVLLWATE